LTQSPNFPNIYKDKTFVSKRKERAGKKAQFFLLAAVIISAIVVSMGITANRAVIFKEPENFYDYSYSVKKETGAVVDYEIYTGFANNANLDNFVNLLAKDIRDKDPNLDFLFIYGNSSKMTLKNYGSRSARVNGEIVPGEGFKIKSVIREKNFFTEVEETLGEYGEYSWNKTYTNLEVYEASGNSPFIEVSIRNFNFNFDITNYKQVIFIIEKEENNESYVAV
ncbi:MAG: hypothetical protein Q8N88_03140, partial [Nanoarchaeota archaeon]|nr:hypothetical protein [Nanoarchaeota archaeon]